MKYKKPKYSNYKKFNKNPGRGGGISKRTILIGVAIAVAVLIVAAAIAIAVSVSNAKKAEEFNAKIISIQITHLPDKREYFCGEVFDETGLQVYTLTQGGDLSKVNLKNCTITGFDSSAPADQQTITVQYKEFKRTFTVKIKESIPVVPVLESIAMETLPKTEYKIAEGLDTTGGTFVCTYSDGTTKTMELSNEYVYGFVDAYLSGVGEYDITVKYSEMGNTAETTYKITITR